MLGWTSSASSPEGPPEMSPMNGNGGRETTPAAAANQTPATITKQVGPEGTALSPIGVVVARAVRYVANADSAYDTLVVERCPTCSMPHTHRAFEANTSTFERSPHCRKSSTYTVVVVRVVPLAPPLRSRRGRAA